MKAILALDQGTTSSRAIVFDRGGNPIARAQQEIRQIFPQPGWVEHDPEEIFSTQRDVAARALSEARLGPSDVAAIGITNQRETTVLWDRRTGRPLANAIVWQDRRTASRCDALRQAGHEALIRERTGLVVDAYFSGTKLAWLLDAIPGARSRAEAGELAFGTIDSWLAWRLTGGAVHVTDATNASRTLLFNIHDLDWDDDLLALLAIPRAVLPRVAGAGEILGRTRCEGLPEGIPIAAMAGDQQAALFGQACHGPGLAKNTYGTGCFLLMNTGDRPSGSRHRLLTTVARRRDQGAHYALEGSVFIAGAAVQWLRDGLGIIEHARDVEALAASVPDSGGVCFVPALAGLGAPHWDPRARGSIVGLTRGSTRAHLARATLEAIAFQSAELLAAMAADSGRQAAQLRVDGGATANDLLMQIQADTIGMPVVRPRVTETTAAGAAFLAGLAVGFWEDESEVASLWTQDRSFEPEISPELAQDRLARWRRAVERSRDWARD